VAIINEDLSNFDEDTDKIDITKSWAVIKEDFFNVDMDYKHIYIEDSDQDTLNGNDDINKQLEHVASSVGNSKAELYDSGALRHISPF
jgi:hypothetical protein